MTIPCFQITLVSKTLTAQLLRNALQVVAQTKTSFQTQEPRPPYRGQSKSTWRGIGLAVLPETVVPVAVVPSTPQVMQYKVLTYRIGSIKAPESYFSKLIFDPRLPK